MNYGSAIVTTTAANFDVSNFETLFNGVATRDRAIVQTPLISAR